MKDFLVVLSLLYNVWSRWLARIMAQLGYEERVVCPNHVAFIMDGNGRWATRQGHDRSYGHTQSLRHFHDLIHMCFARGAKFLSFYVFAEANWNRPAEELTNIFKIMYKKINGFLVDDLNYRFVIQGRLDRVPKKIKEVAEKLQMKSANNPKTIILCIDYSGRTEIMRACAQMNVQKMPCTETNFKKCLYFDAPDPDLVIRTSGEQRISDFLLWQISYSELYFTEVCWPDFDEFELIRALREYGRRTRRFGFVSGPV
jgi:undecaprenyl diphosphate synthase